ncbi:MAG TPA: DUF5412 family protein [Anaerolineales bacterium]|nr:DUF5412 family protein [Anaerolineales bacterium]
MNKSASSKRSVADYFKIVAISTIILAVVYAVLFGCGALFVNVFSVTCGNEILNEVYSPDRQYKVVIFRSDCGATTRLHTNASLLKADQNISDLSRGNIFSVSNVVEVQAKWSSNRSIKIRSTASETLVENMRRNYDNEDFEISYQSISQDWVLFGDCQ